METKNLLSVKNLSFSLGEKKIIKKINLQLRTGEVLALIGESGSGKSTFLKLIAGLLEPDDGELLLEAEKVTPPSQKLIPGHPKIKIVKQDNPLFPNISLRENIAYELRFFKESYRIARIKKLLNLTRLTKVADQLPRECSEGEQQRASIARAIADEPLVLLLDEPFSNLDFRNKSLLKEEISEIVREENMACIFVTHEVADIYGVAKEMAILKSGKITQKGDPSYLYRFPKSVYEASLMGEFTYIDNENALLELGLIELGSKIIVRPDSVKIKEKEGIKATVKGSERHGPYFVLKLDVKNNDLLAFSMLKYEIGQEVYIDISEVSVVNA